MDKETLPALSFPVAVIGPHTHTCTRSRWQRNTWQKNTLLLSQLLIHLLRKTKLYRFVLALLQTLVSVCWYSDAYQNKVSYFPVFTWHGVSQRKREALLGLCQLFYAIQTRFTDAVELQEWSNQSGGWGWCEGSTFCIKLPLKNKWVEYSGHRNPQRRR